MVSLGVLGLFNKAYGDFVRKRAGVPIVMFHFLTTTNYALLSVLFSLQLYESCIGIDRITKKELPRT